jgi:hypothetical protein
LVHLKIYSLILFVLLALFGATMLHSKLSTRAHDERLPLKNVAPLLPSADPGMDTSARYVRHLGLSVPGSAFSEFPGQPDFLPAGMTWPPPLEAWSGSPGAQTTPAGDGIGTAP